MVALLRRGLAVMMGRRRGIEIFILVLSIVLGGFAVAQPHGPSADQQLGTRTASSTDFDSVELYYRWPARWVQTQLLNWTPNTPWQARWDLSVAQWDGLDDNANFLAFGPVVEWQAPSAPWRMSIGIQPTLISEHEFRGKDLGGTFQFTSHVGLAWAPNDVLVIGLRAQHTSNARLYDSNPGVDMIGFEIGVPF